MQNYSNKQSERLRYTMGFGTFRTGLVYLSGIFFRLEAFFSSILLTSNSLAQQKPVRLCTESRRSIAKPRRRRTRTGPRGCHSVAISIVGLHGHPVNGSDRTHPARGLYICVLGSKPGRWTQAPRLEPWSQVTASSALASIFLSRMQRPQSSANMADHEHRQDDS